MTFTRALSTNNYGPAKFIVASSSANGTHSTLASAMAVATSGDTIFLRDSVTENVTLTPGVNISSWGSGSSLNATGRASITGTLTMTGAGSCTISGIQLQTNAAALLAVTGSAASVVNLQKREWEPKLKSRGVAMIPTDDEAFAELIFSQPDYKNRSQREANSSRA